MKLIVPYAALVATPAFAHADSTIHDHTAVFIVGVVVAVIAVAFIVGRK